MNNKFMNSSYYTKNKTLVDTRYRKFKSLVNMSAKEMKLWKKDPCSKAASLKRLEVVNRVTRLLEKPKTSWNSKDYTDSAKVISYLSRATAIKDSVKPASKLCRKGKNFYALKNWAFDREKIKKNPNSLTPGQIKLNKIKEQKFFKQLELLLNNHNSICTLELGGLSKRPVKLYGILLKSNNTKQSFKTGDYYNNYLFQFNPLNQWKYEKHTQDQEKITPIPRTSREPEFLDLPDEHHLMMQMESEFENNELNHEIEFTIFDIANIKNDNIRLTVYFTFVPREI